MVNVMMRLQEFAALLVGLQLPNGLRIDEIEIKGDGVGFDPDSKAVALDAPAKVEARVSAESLRMMLERELPTQVRDPRVSLQGGQIQVEVSVAMIVVMDVTCVVQLRVKDDSELWVDLVSVDKPGIVAGIVEAQLTKVNPVFRTKDLPFPFKITSVRVADRIIVEGEASWTG